MTHPENTTPANPVQRATRPAYWKHKRRYGLQYAAKQLHFQDKGSALAWVCDHRASELDEAMGGWADDAPVFERNIWADIDLASANPAQGVSEVWRAWWKDIEPSRYATKEGIASEAFKAGFTAAIGAGGQVVAELHQIEEMLDAGQGDDDGTQIMPDFEPNMSILSKVEACLFLLEKRRDVIMAYENKSWRGDPSADERWNAGLDYGQTQLCKVLGVDPATIDWDAATETLDGDVQAVICKILTARFGDDWPSALSNPPQPSAAWPYGSCELSADIPCNPFNCCEICQVPGAGNHANPPAQPRWREMPAPTEKDIIVIWDDEKIEIIKADDNDFEWTPYPGKSDCCSRPIGWLPLDFLPAAPIPGGAK